MLFGIVFLLILMLSALSGFFFSTNSHTVLLIFHFLWDQVKKFDFLFLFTLTLCGWAFTTTTFISNSEDDEKYFLQFLFCFSLFKKLDERPLFLPFFFITFHHSGLKNCIFQVSHSSVKTYFSHLYHSFLKVSSFVSPQHSGLKDLYSLTIYLFLLRFPHT